MLSTRQLGPVKRRDGPERGIGGREMDKGMNRGKMWGLLALVLAIGLMGSALAGGSALAAKGGNGGKHVGGGTTSGYGTCSVTPNPVAQGAQSTINGSGFAPN